MQDHELNQDELSADLETDAFELETGEDFTGEVEGPMDEVEEMSIGRAVALGATAAFQRAAAQLAAQRAAARSSGQPGATARRQQSGRWVRRGNKIFLLGA